MKLEGRLEGSEIRPARTDVTYDVRVDCDGHAFDAQIVNLSAMGFRLRCDTDLEVGSRVTLKVDKLPAVAAVIRWVRGGECGGAFVDPVIL